MRKTIFSQTAVLCGMFLPLFLAIAANNLFATDYGDITVDNGEYRTIGYGTGTVDTAGTVTINSGGYVDNGYFFGTGTVDTAIVNGGYVSNGDYYYGKFNNGMWGGTGTVGTIIVNGGVAYNGLFTTGEPVGTSTVGTVIINNDGYFFNGYSRQGSGTVGSVTLNSGCFLNGQIYHSDYYSYSGTGTVNTVTMNGGLFLNNNGTIDTVTMNGGDFDNGGTVRNLIYNGGNYGYSSGYGGNALTGTLTLNKKPQAGNWLFVNKLEKLVFGQDYGTINLEYKNGWRNDIVNFNASTIDLTGTHIAVNVAALLGNLPPDTHPLQFLFDTIDDTLSSRVVGDGLSVASLFYSSRGSVSSWITGINAIEDLWFSWGTAADESVYLIANGEINSAAGFSWTNETRTAIAWTLPEPSSGAATPEPATLALFGLGIAGLAAMRKRQRK